MVHTSALAMTPQSGAMLSKNRDLTLLTQSVHEVNRCTSSLHVLIRSINNQSITFYCRHKAHSKT